MRDESRDIWDDAVGHNRRAARRLQRDLQRQSKASLRNGEEVAKGFRVYDRRDGSVVYLGRLQSAMATPGGTESRGNMWILTEDGQRLGFKRFSRTNTWEKLKRKHGSNVFSRGDVVLYRHRGRLVAIYRKQRRVTVRQRFDLEKSADRAFKAENFGDK